MKKSILALIVAGLVAVSPKAVLATDQVCTQSYGGGVVCGAKHEAVNTDIGDVNPALIGAGLLFTSGVLVYLSKRSKKALVS